MTWPTTPVPTTHCDADADSPTDFRADVLQLITDHNAMVAARNAVSGIPALDGDTKIPIAQLPTGTGSNQAALGDHVHTGTYEPANSALVDHLTDDTNPHAVTAVQVGADMTTAAVYAASSKAAPVDDDEFPVLDSAAAFGLKKLPWAAFKATAKTYFDTLYALAAHTHAALYAPLAKGVTNGDTHDHSGGDGGTIAYSSLSGPPTLGTAAAKNIPASGNASSTQVVYGSDTRLSDARTALSHTHAETEITDGALLARLAANETVAGGWTFSAGLAVGADSAVGFANSTAPKITWWSTTWATGVQDATLYQRVPNTAQHAWFAGGVHSDTELDPGSGGTLLGTAALAGWTFAVPATFSASLTLNTVTASGTSSAGTAYDFSALALQSTALSSNAIRLFSLAASIQPQIAAPLVIACHLAPVLELSADNVSDLVGLNVRPNVATTYTGTPPRWIGVRGIDSPAADAADSISDAVFLYFEGNAKASGTVYGAYMPFVANAGATKIPLYHTGGDYSILTEKVRLGDTAVPTEALEVAGNALAKQFAQTLQTITDATSMTWNCANGAAAKITLTGGKTRTLNAPTNHKAGCEYTLLLVQGAATQLVGTWNAAFKFAGGAAPTLTATNGKTDVLRFVSDGTSFFELSRSLNM